MVGVSLMALLLALALIGERSWVLRRLAMAGSVLLLVYIVGAGVRGLWVVLPLAVVLYLVVGLGVRSLMDRRVGLLVGCSLGVLLLLIVGSQLFHGTARPNLLPASTAEHEPVRWSVHRASDSRRALKITRDLERGEPATCVLQGQFNGGTEGQAFAIVRWRDAEGDRLGTLQISAWPSRLPREVTAVGMIPRNAALLELVVASRKDARGSWLVRDLSLIEIGPPWLRPFAGEILYLRERWRSFSAALRGHWLEDRSVSMRLEEVGILVRRLREAPVSALVLGHGLGATFEQERAGGETNYVHNFFLFLLFKLGVVGTAAVLISILGWVVFTAAALTGTTLGSSRRRFLAAALASWIAYLLWSASSPEILNFRTAPLWGLLLSATVRLTGWTVVGSGAADDSISPAPR